MELLKTEGARRLGIVIAVLSVIVFSGAVLKKHWFYEDYCDGDQSFYGGYIAKHISEYNDVVEIKKEKSFLQKFFDEKLVVLGCVYTNFNTVLAIYDISGKKVEDGHRTYHSEPPGLVKVIQNYFFIMLKYLLIFTGVIALPVFGVMWIKNGFIKGN